MTTGKIWLIVVSLLVFLVSIYLNPLNTTTGGQGQGGMGRNGSGSDQHGRRQKHRTVRGAGASGYVLYHFKILSTLFSFFFFPVVSFLQGTTTGGAEWGVSDAGKTTYCLHPPREIEGATGMYLAICRSLFSSSPLLAVFIFHCLFFLRRLSPGGLGWGAGRDRGAGGREEEVEGQAEEGRAGDLDGRVAREAERGI